MILNQTISAERFVDPLIMHVFTSLTSRERYTSLTVMKLTSVLKQDWYVVLFLDFNPVHWKRIWDSLETIFTQK